MSERLTSWVWSVRAIPIIVSIVIVLVGFSTNVVGQTCPPAATTDPDTGIAEGRVSDAGNASKNAAVAFDGLGRFITVWQGPPGEAPIGNDIFILRFDAAGLRLCGPDTVTDPAPGTGAHQLPSIAVNADGEALIGWVGHGDNMSHLTLDVLATCRVTFEPFAIGPIVNPASDPRDFEPSVAIGGGQTPPEALAWANIFDTPNEGLRYAATGVLYPPIRPCGTGGLVCFTQEMPPNQPNAWQAVVAQRDGDGEGIFVIAWGEAEFPIFDDSAFDVVLQLYRADGTPIGAEVLVNDPVPEIPDSTQKSVAVDINQNNDIVCVWTGPAFGGCPGAQRIYGRRFHWDGNTNIEPIAVSDPFRVDSEPATVVFQASLAHPTVSLTDSTDPDLASSFIVAWNARNYGVSPTREEIRAQYFDGQGEPVSREFRLNLDTSPTGTNSSIRRLGRSASHAMDYGPDGQVAAVYTTFDDQDNPLEVRFTLLPPGYQQTLGKPCCKADLNDDGLRDGRDIQPFVDLWQRGTGICPSAVDLCRADLDDDDDLDEDDVSLFVMMLLQTEPCTQGLSGGESGGESAEGQGAAAGGIETPAEPGGDANPQPVMLDCDGDGVSDAEEIASGASADCNGDGYPDACNLALVVFTSYDCNDNGVPDECELEGYDENANGFLDACEPGGGVPVAGEASTEALVRFYEWSIQQTWGPASGLTGAQQFQAVINKLEELGLPIENPWLTPTE